MMMYRFFVIFLIPLFAKAYEYLQIYPCYHTNAPIASWITVQTCDMNGCKIPNGYQLSIAMGFLPRATHDTVKGVLMALHVANENGRYYLPMVQPPEMHNLCDYIFGGCPVTEAQGERVVRITHTFYFPDALNVPLRMEFAIYNPDNKQLESCAGFNFTVIQNF